jgi:hypothetical protein
MKTEAGSTFCISDSPSHDDHGREIQDTAQMLCERAAKEGRVWEGAEWSGNTFHMRLQLPRLPHRLDNESWSLSTQTFASHWKTLPEDMPTPKTEEYHAFLSSEEFLTLQEGKETRYPGCLIGSAFPPHQPHGRWDDESGVHSSSAVFTACLL